MSLLSVPCQVREAFLEELGDGTNFAWITYSLPYITPTRNAEMGYVLLRTQGFCTKHIFVEPCSWHVSWRVLTCSLARFATSGFLALAIPFFAWPRAMVLLVVHGLGEWNGICVHNC